MKRYILVASLLFVNTAWCADPLEPYNIALDQISVSGLSAGACFATQFHVAFSKTIMGVGLFAGIPWYCAKGSTMTALYTCMSPGNYDVQELIDIVYDIHTDEDYVDNASNMAGDKVYIWQGDRDSTVVPVNGEKLVEFYEEFVNPSDIATSFNPDANHGQPTEDYGTACGVSASPYIMRCQYDGAYETLNHIYGGLVRPSGPTSLQPLLEFDQEEFLPDRLPGGDHMDDTGYIYVPSGCADKQTPCKLHIVFHGCHQGRYTLDDEFAMHAGYLEVAELNDIIVLFPQVLRNLNFNPNGCFDWWGYLDSEYPTKKGEQMAIVNDMLIRVTDDDYVPPDPCVSSPFHQNRLATSR